MRTLFLGVLALCLMHGTMLLPVDLNTLEVSARAAANNAIDLNTFTQAFQATESLYQHAFLAEQKKSHDDQEFINKATELFMKLFENNALTKEWFTTETAKNSLTNAIPDERGRLLCVFASTGFSDGIDYIMTNFFGDPNKLELSYIFAAIQYAKKNLNKSAADAIDYITGKNQAPLKKINWNLGDLVSNANILHLLILAIFAEPWDISAGVDEIAAAFVKKIAQDSPTLLTQEADFHATDLFKKNIDALRKSSPVTKSLFDEMIKPLKLASDAIEVLKTEPDNTEALAVMQAIEKTLKEEIEKTKSAKIMTKLAQSLKAIAK
ncbi:TPA: hypothetical protein DDZ86_00870 [Candidatus Dependentiae bacterium]|nr:MAG: hypothetical protein UW09_C0004G0056 [candidate division TM6 bacterium GW2011_GWF2_43_87]HBL98177.1 hypothetical protein [Candidatus Dependentiae bacterium]